MLTPNEGTTTTDADIEDLFIDEDYLKLYNPTQNPRLEPARIRGSDRLVKRIERINGKFDHGVPASHLLHNRETILPSLSETTLERFDKMIIAINNTLSAG